MTAAIFYCCPAQRPTFYSNRPAHRALPKCPYGQSATVVIVIIIVVVIFVVIVIIVVIVIVVQRMDVY